MQIDGVDYRIASNKTELKKAYRLVYENYIEKQFCRLDIHKMRIFLFDALPETRTFVGVKGGEVLATATLVFDSEIGLPSEGVFPDRLKALRDDGKRLVEFSKLSSRRDLGVASMKVLPQLFRSCWLYALKIAKMSHAVIMVEPPHVPFYKRYYFFEEWSDVRQDARAADALSVLLGMPLDLQQVARESADTMLGRKRYQMHFDDPCLQEIEQEFAAMEESQARISASLTLPRSSSSTITLSKEEREFMEFKLFTIDYNIGQLNTMAHSSKNHGWYSEAVHSYERLLKTIPSWAFRKERARILTNMAENYFALGEYGDQVLCAKRAAEMTWDPNLSSKALTYQALGTYFVSGEEAAMAILEEAQQLAQKAHHSELIRVAHVRGMIFNNLGKAAEARSSYQQIVSLFDDELEARQTVVVLSGFFGSCRILEDFETCEEIVDRCGAVAKQLEEEQDAHFGHYCMLKGGLHFMRSEHREAIRSYSKAITGFLKKENPLNYAIAATWLGRMHLHLGEFDVALEQLNESLDIPEAYLPGKSHNTAKSLKAMVFLLQNKTDQFQELFSELNASIQSMKHPVNPNTLKLCAEFLDFVHLVNQTPKTAVDELSRLLSLTDTASAAERRIRAQLLKHTLLSGDVPAAERMLNTLLPSLQLPAERFFDNDVFLPHAYAAMLGNDEKLLHERVQSALGFCSRTDGVLRPFFCLYAFIKGSEICMQQNWARDLKQSLMEQLHQLALATQIPVFGAALESFK